MDRVTIGAQKTKTDGSDQGFHGEISHVIVTSEELTDEEAVQISKSGYSGVIPSGSAISEMFQNQYDDNSWVFTGGEAVQGGFSQTRGMKRREEKLCGTV
ncbi:MAG: hypothetical protein ACLTKE_12215 [Coprococcus sp.]